MLIVEMCDSSIHVGRTVCLMAIRGLVFRCSSKPYDEHNDLNGFRCLLLLVLLCDIVRGDFKHRSIEI
ncbi:unnamed protein product [Schistosoma mattheei]|uniref:Uncharacterized protein n=1 Tax=Schistosoma mattheei TaxID=31246 RepID=A0AA85BQW1_9TREM|nr:unnamed protein product [Schistosoma mattheei]CAH8524720.1 unnamed protein product [Schistosoma mattheei]